MPWASARAQLLLWGIDLPPLGSARSWIMEEMVHRERMRSWHYHYSNVLGIAAQVSGDKTLVDKLATHLDTLFNMELHSSGSYDFIGNTMLSEGRVAPTDADLFAKLDRMPDV